jgi:hypothetical protein
MSSARDCTASAYKCKRIPKNRRGAGVTQGSSPEFGIAIAVLSQKAINFGRRSLLRSASFPLRYRYGGQDGGQASQNSTLQNSLAVKCSDQSGLPKAKAEI